MIGRIKQVGNDIMFHAITHGDVHNVIALLADNEVNVNGTNINGQTALHVSYQDWTLGNKSQFVWYFTLKDGF